jgi:hypothetical protein
VIKNPPMLWDAAASRLAAEVLDHIAPFVKPG